MMHQQLLEIEQMEMLAHEKLQNAMMNMRPGMSPEHLKKFREQSYQAAELHSRAMDLLRDSMNVINSEFLKN